MIYYIILLKINKLGILILMNDNDLIFKIINNYVYYYNSSN